MGKNKNYFINLIKVKILKKQNKTKHNLIHLIVIIILKKKLNLIWWEHGNGAAGSGELKKNKEKRKRWSKAQKLGRSSEEKTN